MAKKYLSKIKPDIQNTLIKTEQIDLKEQNPTLYATLGKH